MRTLKFNHIHKNGWLSWKIPGVPGALFIDKRLLSPETLANPPATIDVDVPGLVEEGQGASEAQVARDAKKAEAEQLKTAKALAAADKAKARLEKLTAAADKAKAKAEAAAAKASPSSPAAPVEQAADLAAL